MYSSRVVFMLLVLLVVYHYGEAKSGSRRNNKKSSKKSSKQSGLACTECSVCPRVCSYREENCYRQFDIPDEIRTDIFIDEFEMAYSPQLTLTCQAACSANADCKTAIRAENFSPGPPSVVISRTCILSKLTPTEISATVQGAILREDCLQVGHFDAWYLAYTVSVCIIL